MWPREGGLALSREGQGAKVVAKSVLKSEGRSPGRGSWGGEALQAEGTDSAEAQRHKTA